MRLRWVCEYGSSAQLPSGYVFGAQKLTFMTSHPPSRTLRPDLERVRRSEKLPPTSALAHQSRQDVIVGTALRPSCERKHAHAGKSGTRVRRSFAMFRSPPGRIISCSMMNRKAPAHSVRASVPPGVRSSQADWLMNRRSTSCLLERVRTLALSPATHSVPAPDPDRRRCLPAPPVPRRRARGRAECRSLAALPRSACCASCWPGGSQWCASPPDSP